MERYILIPAGISSTNSFQKEQYLKKIFPNFSIHGLIGETLHACSQQTSSVSGPPLISQDVVGTLIVPQVSLLPLKLNLENQERQLANLV